MVGLIMAMLNKWEIKKLCAREYWVGAIRESNNYGKFEVVEYTDSANVRVRFIDTGYEKATDIGRIKSGEIKDPLYGKYTYEGKVYRSNNYGDFKIIEYVNAKKVKVRFIETGYEKYSDLVSILSGGIRDILRPNVYGVGYIGEGKYKSCCNGKDTKVYSVWAGMLERCYRSKVLERKPRYKGCTVAEEWHNFQRFAEWFEEHYIEGYQLDKDIRVEGNKIYSSDTCMFVSNQENSEAASAKHYKAVNPEGCLLEIYNMNKFCRENELTAAHMYNLLNGKLEKYRGWTKYEEENDNAKT